MKRAKRDIHTYLHTDQPSHRIIICLKIVVHIRNTYHGFTRNSGVKTGSRFGSAALCMNSSPDMTDYLILRFMSDHRESR